MISLELKAVENYVKYQEKIIDDLKSTIQQQQLLIREVQQENESLKRELGKRKE